MNGTIYVHPITNITDTLPSKEIFELRDQNGMAIWFARDIYTNVCLSGDCRKVHIRIYWNGATNYYGFDLPANEALAKTDHIKFNTDDYEKLDKLLSNSNSILQNLAINELTIQTNVKNFKKLDGHSGATLPAIQEYVVTNAAYTCFTLWHIVYGNTRVMIRSLLDQRVDSSYLELVFAENDPQYLSWAIDFIKENSIYHQAFYPRIIKLINSDETSLSRNALGYFTPGLLSDVVLQKELLSFVENVSVKKKFDIIGLFSSLPEVDNETILLLLVQFENKKLSGGMLGIVCRMISSENMKDTRIVEKITNISRSENLYVRNITQKLLSVKDN